MGFRFIPEKEQQKRLASLDEKKDAMLKAELAKWANMVKDHSLEQQLATRCNNVRKKASRLAEWGNATEVEKAIVSKKLDLVFRQGNIDLNRVDQLLP